MKMIIEISGGVLTCITATEDCEVFIVDHDNLKESEIDDSGTAEDVLYAEEASHPDCITLEEDKETPVFDAALDEALLPYRGEINFL